RRHGARVGPSRSTSLPIGVSRTVFLDPCVGGMPGHAAVTSSLRYEISARSFGRPSDAVEARRRWTGHSGIVNDGISARRGPSDDGLWSPGRRALTIGLVLNVTIVASEALAVGTILPIVARDLGGIDLYGWVFAGFFLGNLLGIVVAGMLIDRGGLARPFVLGIGLFSAGLLIGGLTPSMGVLVVARVIPGFGA